MFRLLLSCFLAAVLPIAGFGQSVVVNFEDLSGGFTTSSPGTGTYTNGQYLQPAASFTSYATPNVGATFSTFYDNTFGDYSSAFSHSNVFNNVTSGDSNQYAAYNVQGSTNANGAGGSARYVTAFNGYQGDATVQLPNGYRPQSMAVTNTTYTYLMISTGIDPNGFMKGGKFGGADGTQSDFLLLTVYGKNGTTITGTKEIYLAAMNYTDKHGVHVPDAMLDRWTTFDLSSLGDPTSLEFDITSSRNNAFGNTAPAYFALDNLALTSVPEPGSIFVITAGAGLFLRWRKRRKQNH